jgi:hypothetical protein
MMPDRWILDLLDDDVLQAIAAIHDTHLAKQLEVTHLGLMPIWCNPSTGLVAQHLADCGFDQVLAVLTWSNRDG